MPSRNHDRSPDKQGFSVALPKGLLAELELVAKQESRSRNGQIEYFLNRAIREWKEANDGVVAEPSPEPYGKGKESGNPKGKK